MGCRRSADPRELVRLARDGDRLVPGQGRSGRGAWLCAGSPACLERALAHGALARALRHQEALLIDRPAIEGTLAPGHKATEGVGG